MVLKRTGLRIYKTIKKLLESYGIASIYPINLINSYLIKHLRQNFAVVQGHKMFLDTNDSQNLSIDEYFEKFEVNFAKQNIIFPN